MQPIFIRSGFQNADDFLFAETASLHRLSPQLENRLTSDEDLSGEHVTRAVSNASMIDKQKRMDVQSWIIGERYTEKLTLSGTY